MPKITGKSRVEVVKTISLVTGSPTPAPTSTPAPKTGQSQTLPMPPAASIKGEPKGTGKSQTQD